jgi:hypothetical protein
MFDDRLVYGYTMDKIGGYMDPELPGGWLDDRDRRT